MYSANQGVSGILFLFSEEQVCCLFEMPPKIREVGLFWHEGLDSVWGSMCVVLCAGSVGGPWEPDKSWKRGGTKMLPTQAEN